LVTSSIYKLNSGQIYNQTWESLSELSLLYNELLTSNFQNAQ